MLAGLFQYQRFIWTRAITDLRHRYAGTGLGLVWNVVHPLALIGLYSVIFTNLMSPPPLPGLEGKFSYTLYLCSGFLPWLAFAECVTRGAGAFIDNAPYLKKLPVPEQVFVAQTAASASLGLVISFSLLLIISLGLGLRPTWTWLLLPLPLVSLQLLGFGVGLVLGTLNVFLRDIGQLLAISLQVVMWTLPIVYIAHHEFFIFHPLYPAVNTTRELFLYGNVPSIGTWGAMLGWAVLSVCAGWAVFRKLRNEIRDVL